MPVLAIDLGGTKLAMAVISDEGHLLTEQYIPLENRQGKDVGRLIAKETKSFIGSHEADVITSIGICIPGISLPDSGTVWVPNIPGWDAYPLQEEIQQACGELPVTVDDDRSCCILGETWKGKAIHCKDAIFMAIGTGIGAGILVNGSILRGAARTAGAIGWMALERPYREAFKDCGCFESRASGAGMAKTALELMERKRAYKGMLRTKTVEELTASVLLAAYDDKDPIALEVIGQSVELWGMGIANLVSLFNPEKIILGGGVFGPAVKLIPFIYEEALKWAQPVSIRKLVLEPAGLGVRAALYGAALRALQNKNQDANTTF